MITGRLRKAIRVPPRNAMLSHAVGRVGGGWGFGLHEALDQAGALLGPFDAIELAAIPLLLRLRGRGR